MKPILAWAKQPTTLLALAIVAAGVAYWLTRSAAVAAGVVAAILGGVNDHTQDLLARMEAMEDAARPALGAKPISAVAQAATVASAVMTVVKPLTAVAIAVVLGG